MVEDPFKEVDSESKIVQLELTQSLKSSSYSLSCSFYSFCLDKLVKRFRAKPVYIGGQLVYCLGMVAMAVTRFFNNTIISTSTTPQ